MSTETLTAAQLDHIIDALAEALDDELIDLNGWPQADWQETAAWQAWFNAFGGDYVR